MAANPPENPILSVSQRTYWANQTTRYGYDRVGRLRVLRHTAEGKTLGHFAFEVDKRGNRTVSYEALPRATNGVTTIDKGSAALQYSYRTWNTRAASLGRQRQFSPHVVLNGCANQSGHGVQSSVKSVRLSHVQQLA